MIIYLVTNIVNGKRYVGQTVQTLAIRRRRHLSSARNGSSYHFHRAIRKYGEKSFIWETICTCSSQSDLYEKEALLIEKLGTLIRGYNMVPAAKGFRHTSQVKANIKLGMQNGRKKDGTNLVALKEKDIKPIIHRVINGENYPTIAKDYNVSRGTIHSVATRRTWGNIELTSKEEKLLEKNRPTPGGHMRRLTDDQVVQIKDLLETTNLLHREIAEIYNVSAPTISKISRRVLKYSI